RIVQIIHRDERSLLVPKYPAKHAFRCRSQQLVDLRDVRPPLDLEDAIGKGCVEQRDANSYPVEFAKEFWINEPDGCRRSCGSRYQRHQRGSGPPKIFVWEIDDHLRIGDIVDRGDYAVA